MSIIRKPIVLLILDGWGIAPPGPGNPILLAKTPVLDALQENHPHTLLTAHGRKVGLPHNQVGNSEAGHINLSSGWIVDQDTIAISSAIKDGTFFKNTAFQEALKHAKKYNTKLHIMGILTNGESAHSSPDHVVALLKLAHDSGIKKVFLHLFTDGRDSPRFAADKILRKLEKNFYGEEKIATIIGRFYAMDRKKDWQRTERAYNALTIGKGLTAVSAEEAITVAYGRGETDEFIQPTVIIGKNKKPITLIEDNDVIIFFNLRSDRARQLTKCFVQPNFEKMNPGSFSRKRFPKNIRFCAMTDFGPDLPRILTAYPSRNIMGALPAVLKDFKQLYISETEKYAHVTYFFNGGFADPVAHEDRIRIPSPKVDKYDKTPAMSTRKITQTVIDKIKKNKYDFITINFAAPDMIGHTGNLKAAMETVKCVDENVAKLAKEILRHEGSLIITADHGNIEEMIDLKTGEIDVKHSINPVPFMLIGDRFKSLRPKKLLEGGALANVAPTILSLLDVAPPREMTGKTLV